MTLPLAWFGPLTEPSGYADEARAFLLALARCGYSIAAREELRQEIDAGLTEAQLAAIARAKEQPLPGGAFAAVQHAVPYESRCGDFNQQGPTVSRTMFETDRAPGEFLRRLLEVDEVWVPCEFNVETFMRGGVPGSRLQVLPATLDFDLFDPAGVEPLPVAGLRGFTFLASFDFTDRKGWDVLLDAWARAFGPDDDVCLLLKLVTLSGSTETAARERIERYLAGRPTAPIVIESGILPVESLPRLYAAADAYVLASRGEGWGRPYMEAMAMGLPTIASRWSGNLMFMDEGNAWLVDGRVVDVPEDAQRHTPIYRGHRWFHPDADALAACMREVFADGPAVAERASRGRAELLERYGPQPVAECLVELVEGALERWQWRRSRPVACVWRGDFGSMHSLAIVNDGVADALERAGAPVERRLPDGDRSLHDAPGVASHWPPRFEALSKGPFVLYQPWEFGRVPARWVEEIRRRVDEVWTPSEYVREAYVASGVAPELVHVVPNGVDLERFRPDGSKLELSTAKRTVFLFVGGTAPRKNVDGLLDAYGRAFKAADDVCLVVKAMGQQTLYSGFPLDELLERHRARPDAPEVVLFDEDVPFDEMPALYRAADVLVAPYRAEGFCLPVLEALACGVPSVVTAGGPTDEFVSDACAWRVASERVRFAAEKLPGEYRPAADGFWLEPDPEALVTALRAAAGSEARARRAAAAREHAERCSWERAAEAAATRLKELTGRRPIREVPEALVEDRKRVTFTAAVEWGDRENWLPAILAYAEAFDRDADTTLALPVADEAEALELVLAELTAAGVDPSVLPDVALVEVGELDPVMLELAADAVIVCNGHRPTRARAVVSADATALRAVAASKHG